MRKATKPDLIFNIKIQTAFSYRMLSDNRWGRRAWQAVIGCEWKVFACWVSKSCFTSEYWSQVLFCEAYSVAVSKYALFVFVSWNLLSYLDTDLILFFATLIYNAVVHFRCHWKAQGFCDVATWRYFIHCCLPGSSAPASFELDFCRKSWFQNFLYVPFWDRIHIFKNTQQSNLTY